MPKIFSVIPLLLLCFCFVGCGNQSQPECYFEEEIPLVLTLKKTETASSGLVVSNIAEYQISWDENIIDYNQETKLVTAKNVGNTKIFVMYKLGEEEKSVSRDVVVKNPDFAENINLSESYKLKNDKNYTYTLQPNITSQNGDNFAVFYQSENNGIFTVDKFGEITPTGVGQAKLFVKAVSGLENGVFTYIQTETNIIVEEEITSVKLEIFDDNMQAVPFNDGSYNLFYGSGNIYHIKLSSNQKISGCEIGCVSTILSMINTPTYNGDCEVSFPIRPAASGVQNFYVSLIDDALNKKVEIKTNQVPVNCYKEITSSDVDISVVTTYEENGTEKDVYVDSENGNYTLFCLGGDDEAKIEGQNDKKFFYAFIIFDNLNEDCYNKFTIINNSNILEVKYVSDTIYYIETTGVGVGSIDVISNDTGNWSDAVRFEVKEVEAQSCSFYQEKDIYFDVEDETGINLAVTNIVPSYTTVKECELQVISEEGKSCPIRVLTDKTTIYPVCVGNCFAKVTYGETTVVYSIYVVNMPNFVKVESYNYQANVGETVSVKFEVLDKYGKFSYFQDVSLEFISGECEYFKNSNVITFEASSACTIKFVIKSKYGGTKTDIITIVYK